MSSKKPRRRPAARRSHEPGPAPARRVPIWAIAGAAAAIVVLGLAAYVAMSARVGSAPGDVAAPTCGWDFTTPEGIAANKAYLTQAADWLIDQPAGATPAPPDSPYWHGDCPVPSGEDTAEPTDEDATP